MSRPPSSAAPPYAATPARGSRPPPFVVPPSSVCRDAAAREPPSSLSPSMKGPSPSTKKKASCVKARSQRRPFHTHISHVHQVRRSHVGAKLASYSSSDGSPEHPVVVSSGDAGSGSDGSCVCAPVFGASDRIPRSSDNIGESSPSSASIPRWAQVLEGRTNQGS